jgi:hypothetical protein
VARKLWVCDESCVPEHEGIVGEEERLASEG